MKTLINNIRNKIKEIKKQRALKAYLANTQPIKIVVGSGGFNLLDKEQNWLLTDQQTLNITNEQDWEKLLGKQKATNIMAEHVWEHLTAADTFLANKYCHQFLATNGVLRLAVPDGFNPDKDYINYVKPGGNGSGADDHKILYNHKSMQQKLEEAGFKVQLLEYWDESGNFHFTDWSDEGGRINRSRRYDHRNRDGKLNYTSLIVDAIKVQA